MESYYVSHAGLELMDSSSFLASVFPSARKTGLAYHTWLFFYFVSNEKDTFSDSPDGLLWSATGFSILLVHSWYTYTHILLNDWSSF
jgi:hypothetical protein